MGEQEFYAHGKLLLTGEYLVLKGAHSLAFPTALGQWLKTSPATHNLSWKSKDVSGGIWFSAIFDENLKIIECSDPAKAEFLQKLLTAAMKLSKRDFIPAAAETQLEFPRNWGLGSSSTLTYLIARWLDIDPFELFFATQNGSGYDIACAQSNSPLVYQLTGSKPKWRTVALPEVFEKTCFIYLNEKQHSRKEVKRFLQKNSDPNRVAEISALTDQFLQVSSKEELQELMHRHEEIIAQAIGLPPIKAKYFPDYDGELKSLGAWGGDFIMAVGTTTESYFKAKGFNTILKFTDLISSGSGKNKE